MRSTRPPSWCADHRARRREAEERGHRQRDGGAHRRRRVGAALQSARHRIALRQGRAGRHLRSAVARHRRAVPARAAVHRRLSGGLAAPPMRSGAGRVAARSGLLRAVAAAGRGRHRRNRARRQGGAAGGARAAADRRCSWASCQLSAKLGYHLYVSQQPGVEAGMVVRELPLDLAAALPLALGAGEEVELAVRAAEPSAVRALTEEGGALEISIDDATGRVSGRGLRIVRRQGRASPARAIDQRHDGSGLGRPGEQNPARDVAACRSSRPRRSPPCRSFRASPRPRRRRLDLAAGEARTFVVAADDSALYRLESTGLLATAGALRTRTRANLLSQAENGVGRNFCARRLPARRRLPADRAAARRERRSSRSRAGARADRGGGRLWRRGSRRARRSIRGAPSPIASAVTEAGVSTSPPGVCATTFAVRLEDADGWPVAAPLANGAPRRRPRAGRLPADRAAAGGAGARCRAGVARDHARRALRARPACAGARQRDEPNLWLEPEAGAPRDPDRWRFTLPARDRSHGDALRRDDGRDPATPGRRHRPSRRRSGAAGPHLPRRARRGRVRGRGGVVAEQQPAALSRSSCAPTTWSTAAPGTVRAPGEITLAVGETEPGRARLVRALRRACAADERDSANRSPASDDRPDDWNFLLGERLAPGRYRLRVDPVGSASGDDQRSRCASCANAPSRRSRRILPRCDALFEVADEAVVVPLTRPAAVEIVAVGARAGESLGLALEERSDRSQSGSGTADGWRVLSSTSGREARLALPLAPSTGHSASADLVARPPAGDRRGHRLRRCAVAPERSRARPRLRAHGAAGSRAWDGGGGRRSRAARLLPARRRRRRRAAELLQALAAGSTFESAAPTLAPVGFTLPLAAWVEGGGSVAGAGTSRPRRGG